MSIVSGTQRRARVLRSSAWRSRSTVSRWASRISIKSCRIDSELASKSSGSGVSTRGDWYGFISIEEYYQAKKISSVRRR